MRALCCASSRSLSSALGLHLWLCRQVGLAQPSHQRVNHLLAASEMDGPILHSHRWALLGVLFSKATLGQGLLSHLSQKSLTTLSKSVSQSQVVSGAPSSASPLLAALLGHVWSSGPKCEMGRVQKPAHPSSHCPPWLPALPGKYQVWRGHTRHLPSPASCLSIPTALVSAGLFQELWPPCKAGGSCGAAQSLSAVSSGRVCHSWGCCAPAWGFLGRDVCVCATSVVGGSVVTARMI